MPSRAPTAALAASIARAALAALLCLAAVPAVAGDAFLADYDDLPLMPGLRENRDAGLLFQTGEGRIVEAYAQGRASAAAVLAFYAATLPQLGWERLDDTSFRRDHETLRLRLLDGRGTITLHFSISPVSGR